MEYLLVVFFDVTHVSPTPSSTVIKKNLVKDVYYS